MGDCAKAAAVPEANNEQKWKRHRCKSIGGVAVEGNNEALVPGRVPINVRSSVHGPKKTGRSPFRSCCYEGKKTAAKSRNPRVME